MYTWVDGKKFSDSRYLPTVNYISKNCVPFIRSQFELNNFRRLPVIKEEEGYASEEEVPRNILRNTLLKKKYVSQKDWKSENTSRDPKPLTKLPPLNNINCLMNTDIKQSRSIWDTNFGKRLINGKVTDDKELKSIPTATKKARPNSVRSCSEKFRSYQPAKPVSRRKNVCTQSNKIRGDKGDCTEINAGKKKPKKSNKEKQNSKKKSDEEVINIKKSSSTIQTKSTEKVSEIPSRELSENCPTVSSFSKNQRFLTECIQSILDGQLAQNQCELCNENFQNLEELGEHKKQHEAEKEVCLLCEKVFYSPNEFIQHLLTHEGVDRFSCKKCKKYFPSLRKYKQHCLNYHFTPSEVNFQSQSAAEYVKKWLPKFECKRCKIEFASEEEREAHRRDHVKKDLAGAYLLSPKYI